jgi:hypothetical protein
MPRGGRRVGSGRKPTPKPAVILGMDGSRLAASAVTAEPVDVEQSPLLKPPADLNAKEASFWKAYARLAIEQRTLVPSTVAGFRELCEQFAFKSDLAAEIDRVGAASVLTEKMLVQYTKLVQRVDSSLARFKLTAMGKPADGGQVRKPVAANPWAAVGKSAR